MTGDAVTTRKSRCFRRQRELVEEDRVLDKGETISEESVRTAEQIVSYDLGEHQAVVRVGALVYTPGERCVLLENTGCTCLEEPEHACLVNQFGHSRCKGGVHEHVALVLIRT